MSNAFSHFHPNPGWTGSSAGSSSQQPAAMLNENIEPNSNCNSNGNTLIVNTVGKHFILELYDCDCARLDDEDFRRSAISNAALSAGVTLLQRQVI